MTFYVHRSVQRLWDRWRGHDFAGVNNNGSIVWEAHAVVPNSNAGADLDTIATLLDLARADRKDDFTFLARSAGAKPEELDELWRGTRARLALDLPKNGGSP